MIKTTLRKNKPLYPTAKRVGRPKLNWTKQTYKEAWDSFEKSLTSARVPCTKIDRYPVIARWRNDV